MKGNKIERATSGMRELTLDWTGIMRGSDVLAGKGRGVCLFK